MEPSTVEYADWTMIYGDIIDIFLVVGLLVCIIYAIIDSSGDDDAD